MSTLPVPKYIYPDPQSHLVVATLVMALRMMQSSRGMKTLASGAYKQTPASAQKVMDTFAKYKACAVLRTPKAEQCGPAMQAAIDGGFDIVEFTLTTPGCLDQVANFRKKYDGKVMVGCGTVMDIPDAKVAHDKRTLALSLRLRLRPGCSGPSSSLSPTLHLSLSPNLSHSLSLSRSPTEACPEHSPGGDGRRRRVPRRAVPRAGGGHLVRAQQHRHHPGLPDADRGVPGLPRGRAGAEDLPGRLTLTLTLTPTPTLTLPEPEP